MEDKYFDDFFKDKLDLISEDDFTVSNEAWNNMETVMSLHNVLTPPKGQWKKYAILGSILLLLLGNSLFVWKYFDTNKEVVTLRSEIISLKTQVQECAAISATLNTDESKSPSSFSNANLSIFAVPSINNLSSPLNTDKFKATPSLSGTNASFLSSSNLFSVTSITSSSTIFSNQTPFSTINATPLLNSLTSTSILSSFSEPSEGETEEVFGINKAKKSNALLEETTSSIILPIEEFITSFEAKREEGTIDKLKFVNYLETKNIFPKTPNKELDLLEMTLTVPTQLRQKPTLGNRLKNTLYSFKPNNYIIGATSGYTHQSGTDRYNNTFFNYGGNFSINFVNNFRLSAGMNWQKPEYYIQGLSSGIYPDDLFRNFPNLQGFSPADRLDRIEVKSELLRVPLSLTYHISTNNKLSPFFGMGTIATYSLKQELEYSYQEAPFFEKEYEINGNLTNRQFQFHNWTTVFGLEYQIIPKLNVQLQGVYGKDFRLIGVENRLLDTWEGRLSLQYLFR